MQAEERLAPGEGLEWRLVGPFRGGRVVAVAGHPTEPATFYFGACAGGVWKTTDGGAYWQNISDGYFNTAAIGALAVSTSDPNVIYAGTGETAIRGNVSHGDGVYRSTDGGQTWTNLGLSDTHAISRVRIHPTNPDIVYVSALGHVWGPNETRGVYRSTDGGQSWERVLYRGANSGAIDLSLDPNNPRILYAALWDAQRYPWAMRSGGPGSGIFRSNDGGDTWAELTRKPGLPTGVLGKIGIALSPARTGRVYAIVEAEDGALFRSDDGGEAWTRGSEQNDLRRRAWYYQHIYADPQDADTVWIENVKQWKSVDGGANFFQVPSPHNDNHDLWIDPNNTQRMINGNDGGACVTFNGGITWSSIENQPTAQFYHVTTDHRVPYNLYGSQQDNTAMAIASASIRSAITFADWFEPGGGESGYIAVKPNNENIVVGGAVGSGAGHGRLTRYNHETKETRLITVWPEVWGMGRGAKSARYRFQWTFPIFYSPHNSDVLYVASQHVHRSTDDGQSWEVISPDLTRNDPSKQEPSGGPITKDNTGAEFYNTIFALVESPHREGLFWAGSDDGLIHISHDGGKNWENITPPDLPEWALISVIEASPHDPATAYVAATRYKLDDFAPYLYKTSDYGKTWTKIVDGIPANVFTRTIREDPNRRGLLYVGTETGMYISFDDGGHWEKFQLNLPICPIYDLHIKGTDLIAATSGRSFWILDNLNPLHEWNGAIRGEQIHLFQPQTAQRLRHYGRFGENAAPYISYGDVGGRVVTLYHRQRPDGQSEMVFLDAGKNPPEGAVIYYWLKDKPEGEVTLTILDGEDKEIRRFTTESQGKEAKPPAVAGLNRFVWNLRYPNATDVPDLEMRPDFLQGPFVLPGTYQVRLEANGQTQTQSFEVSADQRVSASPDDLARQFDLLYKSWEKLSETHEAVLQIRSIRDQVEGWSARLDDAAVSDAAQALSEKLSALEVELAHPKSTSPLAYPSGLNERLALVAVKASLADVLPTQQSFEAFDKVSGEIDAELARLREIIDRDVAAFNDLLTRTGVKPVVV